MLLHRIRTLHRVSKPNNCICCFFNLPAGGGTSNKVKSCTFDSDMCDWHNVPFDDDMNFVVSSSSSGGPSSGAGGSGKFLVAQGRSNDKAQLVLPLELVLAKHDSNHGQMCIRFNHFMKGGSLTLYSIKNQKGLPQTRVTSVSDGKGSWACKKVTVSEVSVDRQLMFEASGGTIAIDDISFTDGAC
ncbi:hypothetical protein OS493_014793 [Desmophyllum pertusum]|uniref:MAM domain-containing protein n=1 Tax=Desmophyllum pertusum TaxID=174260 RepID=A0A9X0CH85_9CNID|nr:hypothetical protein OS493_014793 [Desmophyllum pertusum]